MLSTVTKAMVNNIPFSWQGIHQIIFMMEMIQHVGHYLMTKINEGNEATFRESVWTYTAIAFLI
jgi:hypothetical protein